MQKTQNVILNQYTREGLRLVITKEWTHKEIA